MKSSSFREETDGTDETKAWCSSGSAMASRVRRTSKTATHWAARHQAGGDAGDKHDATSADNSDSGEPPTRTTNSSGGPNNQTTAVQQTMQMCRCAVMAEAEQVGRQAADVQRWLRMRQTDRYAGVLLRLQNMTDEEELCSTQPIFNLDEDVSIDALKNLEVNEVTQVEDYWRETSEEREVFQIDSEIVIAINEGENEMKIDVISDKPEKAQIESGETNLWCRCNHPPSHAHLVHLIKGWK
ncbi:hypothetical protein Syun_006570 [Stephania yunnanensis]|uniref:Uncharacterized protein n=1 Tax=Stephania yunnanensis TaxID=152371 RepID=A0AAP0L096_9MAGN